MTHEYGCDCDDCYAVRKHTKHRHCIECQGCLSAENDTDYCGADDTCDDVISRVPWIEP